MFLKIRTSNPIDFKFGDAKLTLKENTEYVIPYAWKSQLSNIEVLDHKVFHPPIDILNCDNPKKILFIRSYAYGDLLILSGIINYIKSKCPQHIIDYAVADNHHGFIDRYLSHIIGNPISIPVENEIIEQYDEVITVSGLIENNERNKSRNIYDVFYEHMGIDPSTVPNEFKRPSQLKNIVYNPNNEIIGMHPFATSMSRMYNIHAIKEACNMLKDYTIFIFSDAKQKQYYYPIFNDCSNVVWLVDKHPKFEDIVPKLASCSKVICTDSGILHLAQAVGVPTRVNFGSINYEARVKHYTNIEIRDTNPNCRCYTHDQRCPKHFQYSPCMHVSLDFFTDKELHQSVPGKFEKVVSQL